MPVTAKYTHTHPGRKAGTRIWPAQKGAQHQNSPCRGCVWYAGQSIYHRRYRADCKEAVRLIDGIPAEYLLGDRGYDTDEIVEFAEKNGMVVVIPSKKNRKKQRTYDEDLYKLRHLVENAFLKLKQWRGIATRYAKNSASFLAAIQIRCIALWLQVLS